jgi:hypothetical protein
MSKIFELFGYPLNDQSPEATETRRNAQCPFMGADCDGGGNRYLSNVDLKQNVELATFFQGRSSAPSGICSLQLQPNAPPWIICPRRLFFLAKSGVGQRVNLRFSERILLKHAGYPSGIRLGVWSELRVGYRKNKKSFQYTFDYILMPIKSLDQNQIEQLTHNDWSTIRRLVESSGYSMALRNGIYYVDNFPDGYPVIVEVMTSSTSGGNKKKRTTIPMAFEDAILGKTHEGPGINYRQVWARMVSQLIVKSEVGLAWGGKTIWVLQDTLVNYISSSTALDIHQFLSEHTNEVNILSFSYGDTYKQPEGLIELERGDLYAGPISGGETTTPSFQDMIRAPVAPPKSVLLRSLLNRAPTGSILAP